MRSMCTSASKANPFPQRFFFSRPVACFSSQSCPCDDQAQHHESPPQPPPPPPQQWEDMSVCVGRGLVLCLIYPTQLSLSLSRSPLEQPTQQRHNSLLHLDADDPGVPCGSPPSPWDSLCPPSSFALTSRDPNASGYVHQRAFHFPPCLCCQQCPERAWTSSPRVIPHIA